MKKGIKLMKKYKWGITLQDNNPFKFLMSLIHPVFNSPVSLIIQLEKLEGCPINSSLPLTKKLFLLIKHYGINISTKNSNERYYGKHKGLLDPYLDIILLKYKLSIELYHQDIPRYLCCVKTPSHNDYEVAAVFYDKTSNSYVTSYVLMPSSLSIENAKDILRADIAFKPLVYDLLDCWKTLSI